MVPLDDDKGRERTQLRTGPPPRLLIEKDKRQYKVDSTNVLSMFSCVTARVFLFH